MAKRYSGELVIDVVWKEDNDGSRRMHMSHGGYYHAKIAHKGRHLWSGTIGAPASLPRGQGVDSSEMYDSTAHAALSFADGTLPNGWKVADEVSEHASSNDGGWHIGRSPKQAWMMMGDASRSDTWNRGQ